MLHIPLLLIIPFVSKKHTACKSNRKSLGNILRNQKNKITPDGTLDCYAGGFH